MTPFRPQTLAAVITMLISPTLLAGPYSQIIAFGDSLTDSGQFPDSGAAALTPPVPANARFVNRVGPTYQAPEPFGDVAIQHVSRALGLGELKPSTSSWAGVATGVFNGTNYAVGGNTTARILDSITALNGSIVDIPGRDATVPPFLVDPRVRNGYLIDNPKADPQALYYVNGGANDIFNGLVTDPASATAAANNIAAGVNALHAAGAQYIMVSNAPGLDGTALAYFGSQLNTGGAFNPIHPNVLGPLSNLYNEALHQTMRESAANIIPLDIAGLLLEARTSPAKFGFANVNTCFDDASNRCIEDPQYGLTNGTPNADRLLFNDGIHPTAAAQEVIADYMLSILAAPSDLALLPVFGLQIAQSDLKRQQNLLNDTRGLDTFGTWQGSVAIEESRYTTNNPAYDSRYNGDYAALAFAGQRRMNDKWRLGGQFNIGQSRFDNPHDASYSDIENIGISLVATYDHNRYFASAIVQFEQLRYANIYRHTPLGQDTARGEEGNTDGDVMAIATEVGYDISFDGGNWHYGPRLELYVADGNVDGYSEYSTTVTALNLGPQTIASQQADLGIFANYLSTDKTLSLTGKIGLVNEFDMEGDDLTASIRSENLNSFRLPGYEPSNNVAISSQATLSYSPSAVSRIALRYQAIQGDDRARSLSVNLTFHL